MASLNNLLSSPLVIVDVGADGGVHEIEGISECCTVHAFEPRQSSFSELSQEQAEYSHVQYGKKIFHQIALDAVRGKRTLNVTRTPQASSFLTPDPDMVRRARGRDPVFDVVGTEEVDTITLKEFLDDAKIDHVDYMKVDTQGTELSILLAAEERLRDFSVLLLEVEFIPLYKGQPLFDDVVAGLRPFGFRLVDLPLIKTIDDAPGSKKVWGEAIFVNERRLPPDAALKRGAVLCELGYFQDARWMMEDDGVSPETIDALVESFLDADKTFTARVILKVALLVQAYNRRRYAAGKPAFGFKTVKTLIRKLPFGVKLLETLRRSRDPVA